MATTNIQLFCSETFKSTVNYKKVLIILDTNDVLSTLSASSPVYGNLLLEDASELTLIQQVALSIKATTDYASSADCTFLSKTTGVLRHFVISVLPTACSRHNSPSRCHGIRSAVAKLDVGSEDALILIVPKSTDHVFAQVCAVGRCFHQYSTKTSSKPSPAANTISVVVSLTTDQTVLTAAANTIENIRLAQRLCDTPPNILHTDSYVTECEKIAAKLKCDIKVIKGTDLDEQGFGGLWGVGKASIHLPALVVLSFYPPGTKEAGTKSMCLVGKGIVYDTGGLSIKVPPNMYGMKMDMGGSAAVLGGFTAAVMTGGLTRPLHALLCIAENSVGNIATRPDDIHTMLSGKTVEINNTDAEGRLVLGDGVHYASKFLEAGIIVDIATLTGAQLIATGKSFSAIYCNDDQLEATAVKVGKSTGDLTHPIPYAPEFFRNEFKSSVADMKNSVADRGNAQSSCAGQFIGNHLEDYLAEGGKWAHVDMAGPVSAAGRATGYGVALLSGLVKEMQ